MNKNLSLAETDKSLWSETAIASPVGEPLKGTLQADVLVVGGGYTGLSSALHLAEKGASVILLESRTIGFGGSGRNAGLVNAGVWQNPEHVRDILGSEAGDRFNLALRDSPNLVFDLVRRFGMRCKADQCGTVNIAHKASSINYLQERCRQMQEIGARVEMIDGPKAREISGSPVYSHGGIYDPTSGTIQPLSYVYSLAGAAMSMGAQIFGSSAIRSLTHKQGHWHAKTDGGEVKAEQVIMATNAYSDSNCEKVRESTVPVYIFHCATAPLPEPIATSIIPERYGLWDTQTMLTSSRIDSAGRLVMSSAGSLYGMRGSIRAKWMQRLRDRLYPQTRGTEWAFQWTGQIGVTSSKILRVQLLAPGVFAPAGYNGRGIAPGTVMGKLLAETIISGDRDGFPFPIEALFQEKWRNVHAGYYEYGTLALQSISNRKLKRAAKNVY
jgi:glycine/D-amino acid oxidase-like deaminating enzyme